MADAHLNGSLNLADAETVFRTIGEISGDTVRRLPDGETGDRIGWIEALVEPLRATAGLEELGRSEYKGIPMFRVRAGAADADLEVSELGYAAAAMGSYETFRRLRAGGAIAPGARFQASLPTTAAAVESRIVASDRDRFQPFYGRGLRQEVDRIQAEIPHEDLALQWDVAVEIAMIEGVYPCRFADPMTELVSRLVENLDWVEAGVPVGCHLCYGDAQESTGVGEGRHFKEPADLSTLVAVANAVTGAAATPPAWLSMPVPIDRDDDAYFAPLDDLALDASTRLYLGLVHHEDGVTGTQRRIDAAKRRIEDFGVATECGMGRKPTELVPTLLEIQRDVRV